MIEKKFFESGIPKFDEILGGGIQKGSTMLLSGSTGSNIELITKQLASSGNLVYVTTDENQEEIIDTMKRFSWDPSNITFEDIAKKHQTYIYGGETNRVSIHNKRSKQAIRELVQIGSQGIPSQQFGEEDYLATVSELFRINSSRKIIISSIDFFLNMYQHEDVLSVLRFGKVRIAENMGVLIISITRGMHGDALERQLETIADVVIDLLVVQKDSNFERVFSVKKIRNYAKKIGTARYDINDNGFTSEKIERIM